ISGYGVMASPVMAIDGFVKSPISALSFILRYCGVLTCTPHSSGFARLDLELFTLPSQFDFFELIMIISG
ncbi:MAG: hypothetical protein NTU74_09380, partial [Deltaproteobacteria bacterium]|nr:hypothetical protein [Deltaproteobacteria bacterium]